MAAEAEQPASRARPSSVARRARRYWRHLPSFDESVTARGSPSGGVCTLELGYLRAQGEHVRFEDLRVPLALLAVDILSGSEVVFQSGLVWPATLATVAIPGLFPAKLQILSLHQQRRANAVVPESVATSL